jgi:flavin-binding protein dodecin
MIYFKKRANNNLYRLVLKLIGLKGKPHSLDEAIAYMLDIKNACQTIETLTYHRNTTRAEHVKFGKKVHAYKRNFQTTWYIIYDIADNQDIIIKKILCNHQMKKSN